MGLRYVFGPVFSGRLGRSLGLDLTGGPVCSQDCLYCEAGRTRVLTTERKPYVDEQTLLEELAAWRDEHGAELDYVTLGGQGEPCLNSRLGRIIAGVRELMPEVPVAVLTNATMLADEAVRQELAGADVVLPSMDSLVQEEFARLNRPAPGIDAASVAEGILTFARGFSGDVFLEILLCRGVNDSKENLSRLEKFVAELAPARVDVTTMSRPGAFAEARAVDEATLLRFRERLGAAAAPEGAGRRKSSARRALTLSRIMEIIENSVSRRPQTSAQLAEALGADLEQVKRALFELEARGRVAERDGFYAPPGFYKD